MDYKYNIAINQRAVVELGYNLDIIDLAIFDYIKGFVLSNKCMKVNTEEGTFYWVSHKNIMDGMPLLNIRSTQGIINRIKNLIDAGLLVKYSKCDEFGKTLYSFGQNYDKLEFFDTPQQNLMVPPTKLEGNIILDNNIPPTTLFPIENKDSVPQGGTSKRFVKPSIEDIVQYCKTKGITLDAEKFYYYYESKGWVVGKSPMKNWKAAIQTWLRQEAEKEEKENKPYVED